MFNCELKSQMTLSKNTDNIVKKIMEEDNYIIIVKNSINGTSCS